MMARVGKILVIVLVIVNLLLTLGMFARLAALNRQLSLVSQRQTDLSSSMVPAIKSLTERVDRLERRRR
jgi:hypothetical protein